MDYSRLIRIWKGIYEMSCRKVEEQSGIKMYGGGKTREVYRSGVGNIE